MEPSASASASSSAALPLDASAIHALLASMGVEEYEPRVVQQLLEYMQTYAVDVFADAAQLAEHAGRPGQLECEDVQLSARLKAQAAQTHSPQLIEWMARTRNQEALITPSVPNIQLPNPKLCLVEENWQLEPPGRPPPAAAVGGSSGQAVQERADGTAGDGSAGGAGAGSGSGGVAFRLSAPAANKAKAAAAKGGGAVPMDMS